MTGTAKLVGVLLVALAACGDPPGAVQGGDASAVPMDGPRAPADGPGPVDGGAGIDGEVVADARPGMVDGAAVVDGRAGMPDAGTLDAEPGPVDGAPTPDAGYCPEAGASCAGCGTVACVDGVPVCTAPQPCAYFTQAYSMIWPAGVAADTWGSGVAFGDLDGDGAVDALVGTPAGVRALRGDGQGGFSPWTYVMGGYDPPHVASLTLVDHDGDGDLDLFITSQDPSPGAWLLGNDGTGRMLDLGGAYEVMVSERPGGAAWGDYDGDGDLDVFVPGYAYEPSQLLRNDGVGFTDVAPSLGIDDPDAASLQGLWFDYEDDGDLDLLVSNDKGPATQRSNALYRNLGGGVLARASRSLGMTHEVNGMGLAIGDVDGDGLEDLYITDIGYLDGGQLLYRNLGGSGFARQSEAWNAAAAGSFAWGVEFVDLDNDGDLDLVVAASREHRLYENLGQRFVDITQAVSGLPTRQQVGLASADFDGDGRVDLGWWQRDPRTNGRIAYLARNVTTSGNHWLRVALRSPGPNRRGVGATVWVDIGHERRRRSITAGNSFNSTSEDVAHFGLGAVTVVDAVEVRWPDGGVTIWPGPIAADQTITIHR